MTALVTLDADVLVLGEYRASSPLGNALAERGWIHQVGTPDPAGGFAAVLVASRVPLKALEPHYLDETCSQRWVHVDVVDTGWAVAGALIPSRNQHFPGRSERFWDFVVSEFAPLAAHRPTLLIGDLNTGIHRVDEIGATLPCSEYLAELRSAGWVNVWHALNPDVRPPPSTWASRTGKGFRVDHAFLSPCSPSASSIAYPAEIGGEPSTRAGARRSDGERAPLSDHVPVVVDLGAIDPSSRH